MRIDAYEDLLMSSKNSYIYAQGTGAGAITINSTAGGIDIDAQTTVDIDASAP